MNKQSFTTKVRLSSQAAACGAGSVSVESASVPLWHSFIGTARSIVTFYVEALNRRYCKPLRLHIHAYYHTDQTRKEKDHPHLGTHNAWSFEGSRPMIRPNTVWGRHAQKQIDRGHFYCQCRKIGHVCGKSNYPKYEAYVVEQKWVIALWQRRKLTHEEAKLEIVGARGHTQTYLNEILTIEDLEDKHEIEKEKNNRCSVSESFQGFPYRG